MARCVRCKEREWAPPASGCHKLARLARSPPAKAVEQGPVSISFRFGWPTLRSLRCRAHQGQGKEVDLQRSKQAKPIKVQVHHFWQAPVLGIPRWTWPLVLVAEISQISQLHVVQANQAEAEVASHSANVREFM